MENKYGPSVVHVSMLVTVYVLSTSFGEFLQSSVHIYWYCKINFKIIRNRACIGFP